MQQTTKYNDIVEDAEVMMRSLNSGDDDANRSHACANNELLRSNLNINNNHVDNLY